MRRNASSREVPQNSSSAWKSAQTLGRSGEPKMRQRLSSPSCTQRSPAGFPRGMPGIAELILKAIQQAPQPARHGMNGEMAGFDEVIIDSTPREKIS